MNGLVLIGVWRSRYAGRRHTTAGAGVDIVLFSD